MTSKIGENMRQLVYALTGDGEPPPAVDRQLERFVQKTFDDLEDVTWTASFRSLDSARLLYSVFEGTESHERVKALLNPTVFESLLAASRKTNEENVQDLIQKISEAKKSNLFDNSKQQSRENSRHSNLVGGTIELDLFSEQCRRDDPASPVFFMPFEKPDQFEIVQISQKLEAAFEEIESYSPNHAHLIRNYTRKIYVRKAGNLPPSSEQVDTELGAIRLRNVHLADYDHDQLVDDLIHESTHNFLGTFEYLEFPFIPPTSRPSALVRPMSPWSFRPIQVLPFVHAVFVYYAMFNYVSKRLTRADLSYIERKSLLKRKNRYASGFLIPGKLRNFVSSLSNVDDRVLTAIDWMQENVRTRSKNFYNKVA